MALALKQFAMHLKFLEIPLIYGIVTVPWCIVYEGGLLLLSGFNME
jgi:hypothetical protein